MEAIGGTASRMSVLPHELVAHILSLACLSPPSMKDGDGGDSGADDEAESSSNSDYMHSGDEADGPAPAHRPRRMPDSRFFWSIRKKYTRAEHVDLRTCLAVATVCKAWTNSARKSLYRSVQLADAVQLQRFASTLRAWPELGRLVRHLWIGHLDHGPRLPARVGASADAADMHRCFGVSDEQATPEFRTQLVAICGSCGADGSGVMPYASGCDAQGREIGLDEWVLRLYEVRERFIDVHRRRGQQRRPGGAGMARESSRIDHFLHPALFARSHSVGLLMGDWLPADSFVHFDGLPRADEDDEQPPLPTTATAAAGDGSAEDDGSERELIDGIKHLRLRRSVFEPGLPDIRALLRDIVAILRRCPNIACLALNSELERAVTSRTVSFPSALPKLRTVMLGPPPRYWASELVFGGPEHPIFAHVEDLAIYGCLLYKTEAHALAGKDGALPNLKRLRWCYTVHDGEVNNPDLSPVLNTLMILLGIDGEEQPDDGAETEDEQFRVRLSESADTSSEALALALAASPASTTRQRRGVQHLHCTLAGETIADLNTHASPRLLEDPRLVLERAQAEDPIQDVYLARTRWRGVVHGKPPDQKDGLRADHGFTFHYTP